MRAMRNDGFHDRIERQEAYREGLRMAAGDVSRQTVNKMAEAMPVREGDAFLAGYYAELRRLRNYEDLER
jgi:hypothetical protein